MGSYYGITIILIVISFSIDDRDANLSRTQIIQVTTEESNRVQMIYFKCIYLSSFLNHLYGQASIG